MTLTESGANSPVKKQKKGIIGKLFGSFGNKSKSAAKATPTAEGEVALVVPNFFTVVHTFVEGKAEAWWAGISGMTAADQAAMNAKWEEMGFYNHSFMPSSMDGKINCMWETKESITAEEFQAFIDGPDGPGAGVFVNDVHKVLPGAALPSSYFESGAPTPTMPSTGSFFWVYHTFKEGAAEGFWSMMKSLSADDQKGMADGWHAMGLHNHSFSPCAAEGPCICIWESKEPMTAEAFQAFIDGDKGPGGGKVFTNDVFLAMAGAKLPAAYFPQPSVVQHRVSTIKIVSGATEQIVATMKSESFAKEMGSFAGLLGVEMLAIDDETLVTHSRWASEAYGASASAALAKVLGGALKEFIASPPEANWGHVAFSGVGSSKVASGQSEAVRVTTFDVKEGAFGEMLGAVEGVVASFAEIDGLIKFDVLKVGEAKAVGIARYESMATLEAATPTIQAILKEHMAPFMASPPAAHVGPVVWTHEVAKPKAAPAYAAEAKATYEVDASTMWAVMKDWGAPHIVELGPATIEDVSGQGVGATRVVCFPTPDGSVAKWSEKIISVDESAMSWSYVLTSELPFDLKTDTFVCTMAVSDLGGGKVEASISCVYDTDAPETLPPMGEMYQSWLDKSFEWATKGASASASATPTPTPAMPESVAMFFNGEPMAGKAEAYMGTMVSDAHVLKFVGPHAYPFLPPDGLTKEQFGGAAKNLLESFPDLTFNLHKATPTYDAAEGCWAAEIVVMGTHTGAPFTPMAGKLPPIETTNTCVKIGPETFSLWVDEAGLVVKTEVRPGHAGAPHGPPGFYKVIGGELPGGA